MKSKWTPSLLSNFNCRPFCIMAILIFVSMGSNAAAQELLFSKSAQHHKNIESDSEFVSLPRHASYRLVYSADKNICGAISLSLAENASGKIPKIYSQVKWRRDPDKSIGLRRYWVDLSISAKGALEPLPVDYLAASKSNASKHGVIVSMKEYSAGRLSDQNQFLSLIAAQPAHTNIFTNDLWEHSMRFLPQAFMYHLRGLKPHQFPAGFFSKTKTDDAAFDAAGNELLASNFFDLVQVGPHILLSFRSYNTIDQMPNPTQREWLIFSKILGIEPVQMDDMSLNSKLLDDVCYFVRRK